MVELVQFLWVFGAGIIVCGIICVDLFGKKKLIKPYVKWAIVIFLSIWQVGCWTWLDEFDGRFGNSPAWEAQIFIFSTIVIVWFVFQLMAYVRIRAKGTE